MFLEKTANKIKGYVKINVYGFFVERFLNLALKDNIKLWNISKDGDVCVKAYANVYDYQKLVAIAKKTGCKINIYEKVGMPFFIMRHKKRKSFVIFFLVIVAIIYIYNLHIWNVDIVGDFTFPIEEIKDELELENVKVGMLKKSLDLDTIKNNIYMRRHDIAWIGISLKGTNAVVEIVQGNLKKENELDKVPCNIVSTKEGMVYKIDALVGESVVEVGQLVKSGDALISGILSSEWSENRYVSAKGTALLKTWYTKRVKIPYERDIISKTGDIERKYILGIKNYEINLGNNGTKFEKYDTIISSNNLSLFGRFEVPIKLTQITYQEIDIDTITYTKEQAILAAKNEIENSVLKNLKKECEVIDVKTETVESDDGITVIVTIECIEETGMKQKLEG